MSSYLKDAIQSLQSSSSYLRLPSTDGIQSRTSSLHPRNPKALLIVLILVFFLSWRNIITDVCSHFIHRIPSVPVETNPIKNSTLGVRVPIPLSLLCWTNIKNSTKKSSFSHYPKESTEEFHYLLPPMLPILH